MKTLYEIPIFIISYNRLEPLRQCIERYERDGYKNIYILDNASDDPVLIEYLKRLKYEVYFLEKNWGHHVLWDCGLFDDIIENQYYVLTDPDILPIDECPSDYIEIFYKILQKYPQKTKVGFSLKIDDLPESYIFKYDIIRFESFYWERKLPFEKVIYDAPIDTTFALYRPGKIAVKKFFDGIRCGYPYIARHLGWYEFSYSNKENIGIKKYSTSFEKSAMELFRYNVITNLVNMQNDDLYYLLKKSIPNEYIKNNISYIGIIKAFLYVLLKKTAIICHLK